jgi:hypothetical protein
MNAMRKTTVVTVLALLALAWCGAAQALTLPDFFAKSGRKVSVQPPPPPVTPPPPPVEVLPPPPGAVILPGRLMTHKEFAACVAPVAGQHQVTLVHPYTCCPVTVCFCLPCGCPKVRADKNDLEFRYGLFRKVEIKFCKDGTYKVRYRNVDV